jgi:cytochrome c peroxidase
VKRILSLVVLSAAALGVGLVVAARPPASAARLTPRQELGRKLFFDIRLSDPAGQPCAACHAALVGWTGPDPGVNKNGGVYQGAVRGRYGNRKPPAAAYAGQSPVLHQRSDGSFEGGMFWDGRATGGILGDPLAEQAMGPYLNPLEQNNADAKAVVEKVKGSDYAALFEKVWGPGSLDLRDVQAAYEKIGRSIADFERSVEVGPFSSKFDDFWRAARAKGLDPAGISRDNAARYADLGLDGKELEGLRLFATKGLCADCHVLTSTDGRPPLFTDFTYDNIGVPRNPRNPFYALPAEYNPAGKDWVDPGLGATLKSIPRYAKFADENMGKQKVPSLRNADKRPFPAFVKAYMHNGYFKSLKEVVRFYNTRDVAGAGWPAPECAPNVNTREMGKLGLTPDEEDLIVLFLKTLTDR